jgi:hypothetical protein
MLGRKIILKLILKKCGVELNVANSGTIQVASSFVRYNELRLPIFDRSLCSVN